MVFCGKEGITLAFFVFFDQMHVYHATNMHFLNHDFLGVFSSINANKCHIINYLLTSLARYAQRNIGSRSFCTNLVLQKRPGSVISLYTPHVRLIRI